MGREEEIKIPNTKRLLELYPDIASNIDEGLLDIDNGKVLLRYKYFRDQLSPTDARIFDIINGWVGNFDDWEDGYNAFWEFKESFEDEISIQKIEWVNQLTKGMSKLESESRDMAHLNGWSDAFRKITQLIDTLILDNKTTEKKDEQRD
jgi:hypothetical protein